MSGRNIMMLESKNNAQARKLTSLVVHRRTTPPPPRDSSLTHPGFFSHSPIPAHSMHW